jgi:hypothetical protein
MRMKSNSGSVKTVTKTLTRMFSITRLCSLMSRSK